MCTWQALVIFKFLNNQKQQTWDFSSVWKLSVKTFLGARFKTCCSTWCWLAVNCFCWFASLTYTFDINAATLLHCCPQGHLEKRNTTWHQCFKWKEIHRHHKFNSPEFIDLKKRKLWRRCRWCAVAVVHRSTRLSPPRGTTVPWNGSWSAHSRSVSTGGARGPGQLGPRQALLGQLRQVFLSERWKKAPKSNDSVVFSPTGHWCHCTLFVLTLGFVSHVP